MSVGAAWAQVVGDFPPPASRMVAWHHWATHSVGEAADIDRVGVDLSLVAEYISYYTKEAQSSGTLLPPLGDSVCVGGFSALVAALAAGVDVRLGDPVTRIEHGEGGVSATTLHGRRYDAAAVVVTVSVGVLHAALRGAAGSPRFTPPLPEWKAASLRQLGMGDYAKVLIVFRRGRFPRVATGALPFYSLGRLGGRIVRSCVHAVSAAAAGGVLECAIVGARAADFDDYAAPLAGGRVHFAGEGACRLMYGNVHAAVASGARAAWMVSRELRPAAQHAAAAAAASAAWPVVADDVRSLCDTAPVPPSLAAGH